jgi:hypothetical protein
MLQFNGNGNLPQGIHILTLTETQDLLVFNERRQELFNGFKRASLSLQQAGCQKIYIAVALRQTKRFLVTLMPAGILLMLILKFC